MHRWVDDSILVCESARLAQLRCAHSTRSLWQTGALKRACRRTRQVRRIAQGCAIHLNHCVSLGDHEAVQLERNCAQIG